MDFSNRGAGGKSRKICFGSANPTPRYAAKRKTLIRAERKRANRELRKRLQEQIMNRSEGERL